MLIYSKMKVFSTWWVWCLNDSLQGISPPLKAAQAGPTPVSEVKVGPCLKTPHQTAQVELHSLLFLLDPHHSQHQLNIFPLPYFRGIPVRGQVSRTAVDWSPGPDSPAGPHRASLHPELWVRPNWQPGSHRWVVLPCHSLSHLLTLLTHTSWTPTGELSVRVIDSVRGAEPRMWTFAGKTGRDPDSWRSVSLTVGARKHRFQVWPLTCTQSYGLISAVMVQLTLYGPILMSLKQPGQITLILFFHLKNHPQVFVLLLLLLEPNINCPQW